MMKPFRHEKDVKREVKKLLERHGWFWWMPPANAFGRSGISDFHALRAGVFLAIETKVRNNKPTPMQAGFLASVRVEDGFGFCVSEAQLEHLAAWFAAFDRSVAATRKGGQPSNEDGSIMLNAIIELTRDKDAHPPGDKVQRSK